MVRAVREELGGRRCLDDYLAGRRYPLDCLTYLASEALAPSQAARG